VATREQELRRKITEVFPDWLYALVSMLYSICHPKMNNFLLLPHGDVWVAVINNVRWFVPTPKGATGFFPVSLFDEYFLDVNGSDVALDVGACVGDVTLFLAHSVALVIAIEPEPRNLACLRRNVGSLQNVKIVNKAAWNCRGVLELHLDPLPSGHSLIFSKSKESVKVQADTLDNIISDLGIKKVDFIKMDIEGAELEALEGARRVLKTAKKVVIAAYHKREERETSSQVQQLLQVEGFASRVSAGGIVYAWRGDARIPKQFLRR
jgi:FkbM family methyltransferase